jgi:SAM-dependent methyltransferase
MESSLQRLPNIVLSACGTRNKSSRDQWLESRLSQIRPGSTILDAGAGELQYKRFCEHLVYRSQDFGAYNGRGTGGGLQTHTRNTSDVDIVSDIAEIPEPDESYDAVMCIEVLEHIPQPEKAIQEFSRLLKKNGTLILTVPVCSLTHYAPYYFYNGFSKYFFTKYLPLHGYSIKELSHNGNFFEYLAQELRRISYMAKRYSKINFVDKSILSLCLFILLRLLNRFSTYDRGSNEMLSFGLHILATKD